MINLAVPLAILQGHSHFPGSELYRRTMKVLSEYVSKMFGRREANSLCDLSNLELSIGEQFCGVFHTNPQKGLRIAGTHFPVKNRAQIGGGHP